MASKTINNMQKLTLREHRDRLAQNPNRYEQGFVKARENWVRHAYNFYKSTQLSHAEKKTLREHLGRMADLTFDAQNRRPLFEIDDQCFAWNSPRFFEDDFIRYEIGHIRPKNRGGLSIVSNLCFQSARCNQHIQAALNIDDVIFLIGHHESVKLRIRSLLNLHTSSQWTILERELPVTSA